MIITINLWWVLLLLAIPGTILLFALLGFLVMAAEDAREHWWMWIDGISRNEARLRTVRRRTANKERLARRYR